MPHNPGTTHQWHCPRDGAPLEPREKAGFAFYFCRHCSGLLIDKRERRKAGIRDLQGKGRAPACPPVSVGGGRIVSPVSGAPMDAITFKGVTIDLCRQSGHVWLDCGELETIRKQLIAQGKPADQVKHDTDCVDLTEAAVETADCFFSFDDGIESIFEWIFSALDGF